MGMLPSSALLPSLALLSGCTPAQLDALAPCVQRVTCRRNEEIYREGQPAAHVHFILKGEVVLERARAGDAEPMRLAIVRAGEPFGIGEFMLAHYHTTATAMTPAVLLRVTSRDFRTRFLAVEPIRDRVLTQLSEIARYLLFSVTSASGATRLAMYLWRLCREQAREVNGKLHIQAKVRQPEVASLLNLSREHVTRLFSLLRRQGVVSFNRGYPIVDAQWLREAVADKDLADFIVYRDYPRPGDTDH